MTKQDLFSSVHSNVTSNEITVQGSFGNLEVLDVNYYVGETWVLTLRIWEDGKYSQFSSDTLSRKVRTSGTYTSKFAQAQALIQKLGLVSAKEG
jgi:hypothetical protein